MCFSAAGSFSVAGGLLGLGSVAVGRSQRPSGRLFAAIPLGFAVQQAAEGVIWVTIDHGPSAVQGFATAVFLSFAFIAWPLWVPLALRAMEPSRSRRRILGALSVLGAAVSLGALILMFRWQPFAVVAGHHIRYDYRSPDSWSGHQLLVALYAVPTVAPFFVVTGRFVRAIGATLVGSLLLTFVFEREALVSVWCFFAAILSVQILAMVTAPRPIVMATASKHR
jgi:hypothetical protein